VHSTLTRERGFNSLCSIDTRRRKTIKEAFSPGSSADKITIGGREALAHLDRSLRRASVETEPRIAPPPSNIASFTFSPILSLDGKFSSATLEATVLQQEEEERERKPFRGENAPGFFSNESPSTETGPEVGRIGPVQGPNPANQHLSETGRGERWEGEILSMSGGRRRRRRSSLGRWRQAAFFSVVCSIEDRIGDTSSSSATPAFVDASRWTLRRGARRCFGPN